MIFFNMCSEKKSRMKRNFQKKIISFKGYKRSEKNVDISDSITFSNLTFVNNSLKVRDRFYVISIL